MPEKRLPDDQTIKQWNEDGLTRMQMVERWYQKSKVLVTPNAFSVRMGRVGITPKRTKPRYKNLLPWRVKVKHLDTYHARRLRWEEGRRSGKVLDPSIRSKLDYWLARLHEPQPDSNPPAPLGLVIDYWPEPRRLPDGKLVDGFQTVPRLPSDSDIIRKPKPVRRKPAGT